MNDEMLLVGICDDSKEDCCRIEACILQEIEKLGSLCKTECRLFENGEELCSAAEKKSFDLLVIDIEMPGQNGFSLAKKLSMEQAASCIIFVSAYENFVFESQEYAPLWFVRKGMLNHDMALALQKYFTISGLGAVRCRTESGAGMMNLSPHKIIYIESAGHILTFWTVGGKVFKKYGSLKAVEQELGRFHFLRIHKSYLVNQRYIEEIGKREVRLTDGTLLELGRDRRKLLCEAMNRYEREYYGS